MATQVRDRLHRGQPLNLALQEGCSQVVGAVVTTAAVAALGFLPMALAQSSGAEVQRPLATVVIAGILSGTLLTLLVLPGLLSTFLRGHATPPEGSGGVQHQVG